MPSTVKELAKKQLIACPSFLPESIQYEVLMGSQAYGVNTEKSDTDIYGWCIPDKSVIFPHTVGVIQGFGNQGVKFNNWQQHHIMSEGREYDFQVFSIIHYFQLLLDNNPNMLDSLFVPERCIKYITPLGVLVRENRRLFLHQGCYPKFKGYAHSQFHKMKSQHREGSRREGVDTYGYDLKFAYHTVRLLDEVEQLMTLGDMTLGRNAEEMKSIRKGDYTFEQLEEVVTKKLSRLEDIVKDSVLPQRPREKEVKDLLLGILDRHFGNISAVVQRTSEEKEALRSIQNILNQVSHTL